ncbi:hypothetical protein BKA69DRAFT_1172441 [Paraphysoderma sedebokerense]|nr:hypothetical protein BKA69DRAFT_1172441 [Paraphysoderma sedebokerense]
MGMQQPQSQSQGIKRSLSCADPLPVSASVSVADRPFKRPNTANLQNLPDSLLQFYYTHQHQRQLQQLEQQLQQPHPETIPTTVDVYSNSQDMEMDDTTNSVPSYTTHLNHLHQTSQHNQPFGDETNANNMMDTMVDNGMNYRELMDLYPGLLRKFMNTA